MRNNIRAFKHIALFKRVLAGSAKQQQRTLLGYREHQFQQTDKEIYEYYGCVCSVWHILEHQVYRYNTLHRWFCRFHASSWCDD